MSSPVAPVVKGMKAKNQNKMKIGVGSVVKENGGELDNITGYGRIMSISKEVVRCVQDVMGKKNLLVQFEDGQKKEISSSLIVLLS